MKEEDSGEGDQCLVEFPRFLVPDLFITCLNWHSLVRPQPKFNPR